MNHDLHAVNRAIQAIMDEANDRDAEPEAADVDPDVENEEE